MKKLLRKLKLRTWIGLVLIAILLPIVLISLFKPAGSDAAWYNESWTYRQKLTFGNTGSADSDKKVKFDVDTAALTTDKLQADCDDIRFTDINGKLLQFYLDTAGGACDTSSTDYYVLIPSIYAGENTIYMYYGNPLAINAAQSTQFTQSTFSPTSGPTFASEETGPGPVAYWGFDEGYGTTTNDSSQNNFDLSFGPTTAAPTWQTEDQCISGKCVYLDGTDDYLVQANEIIGGTAGVSFSAWIKPHVVTGTKVVMEQISGHFSIQIVSGVWRVTLQNTSSSQTTVSGGTASVGVWTYVEGVYDGSNLLLYTNGNLINSGAQTGSVRDTNNGFIVGCDGNTSETCTDSFLKGYVDEMKIYPYARTATQVKADFTARGSMEGVSAQIGAPNQKYLSDGQIAYYKMDETSWTNDCSTGTVTDSSGMGNNAKSCPNGTGPTGGAAGKFANGGNFDGSNDVVDFYSSNFNSIFGTAEGTISIWAQASGSGVWTDGTTRYLMNIQADSNNRVQFFKSATNNTISFRYQAGGTDKTVSATNSSTAFQLITLTWSKTGDFVKAYIDGDQTGSAQTGLGTWSGALATGNVTIGAGANSGTNSWSGLLDNARVYNRALSSTEVNALYNWGPGPAGWWKLDENTDATTSVDSSGYGLSGTVTGSPTFLPGKYGNALNTTGTSQYVSVSDNVTLDITNNSETVSLWFNPANATAVQRLIRKGNPYTAGGQGYSILYRGDVANDPIQVQLNDTTDGCATPSANFGDLTNTWVYLTIVFNKSTSAVDFYKNGEYLETDSWTCTGSFNTTLAFEIASSVSGYAGKIDDVRVYNYARKPGQIIEDMNGGHPLGGSPISSMIAYYKFDEQTGQTLNNSGTIGSAANATRGDDTSAASDDPTWKTKTDCKVNGCLDFDGTSDYVVGLPGPFIPTTDFTYTVYVNLDSNVDEQVFMSSADGVDQVGVRITTADGILVTINNTSVISSTGITVSTGTWHHIALTRSGSSVSLYFNGILRATGTSSATLAPGVCSMRIGLDPDTGCGSSASEYFDGRIDEFKAYNAGLTAEQVRIDMNAGSVLNAAVTASPEASQLTDGAGNAPVTIWNMDENTGTTIDDTSGNGNSGTISAATAGTWVPGKIGGAVKFVTTQGTKVNISDPGTSSFDFSTGMTLSFWANPVDMTSSLDQWAINKSDAYFVALRRSFQNNLDFRVYVDGAYRTYGTTVNISANTWSYITATYDSTSRDMKVYVNGALQGTTTLSALGSYTINTNDQTFELGSAGGTAGLTSTLDQVTLYNYARSQSQVSYDYNRSAPVGWWRTDECQGLTANDVSVNSNSGTITIGASGTQTAVGTCQTSGTAWGNGVNGKYNSSLNFDGTDDYITMGDPANGSLDFGTGAMSASAWIKGTTANTIILDKKNGGAGTTRGYNLLINGSGFAQFRVNTNGANNNTVTGTTLMTDNNWHLVTGVLTRGGTDTIQIYVDGKLENTANTTASGGTIDSSQNLRVGTISGLSSGFFVGQIDDVQIFNYSLSASQIRKIYNESSAARFGPQSGQP